MRRSLPIAHVQASFIGIQPLCTERTCNKAAAWGLIPKRLSAGRRNPAPQQVGGGGGQGSPEACLTCSNHTCVLTVQFRSARHTYFEITVAVPQTRRAPPLPLPAGGALPSLWQSNEPRASLLLLSVQRQNGQRQEPWNPCMQFVHHHDFR